MASFNGALHTLSHHPHGRALNLFTYIEEGGVSPISTNGCRTTGRCSITPCSPKEQVILQRLEIVSHLVVVLWGLRKLLENNNGMM